MLKRQSQALICMAAVLLSNGQSLMTLWMIFEQRLLPNFVLMSDCTPCSGGHSCLSLRCTCFMNSLYRAQMPALRCIQSG